MARCVAHDDRSPSLWVCEGERGVLLHCYAGCSLEEICQALGLPVKDMFFDSIGDPEEVNRQRAQRTRERTKVAEERRQAGLRIDARREADYLIASARNIDISGWSHARLDRELNRLGDAYGHVERERNHGD